MSQFTITNPARDALPIEGEVLFGRGSECTVRLKDSEVSRKHATVYLEEKKLFIRDEGSANGTFVNDVRIDKAVSLSAGDKIRMGSTEFTIEVADLEDVTPTVFADDLEIDLPTAKGLDEPWEDVEDLKEPAASTPLEVNKKRSPLLFIGVGCGVLFLIAVCLAAAFFAINSLGIFDNPLGDFDLFSGAGRVPEYSLEEVLEQDTVDDRPGVISYLGRPDAFTISEIIVAGSPVRVETWRYFAFGTRVDFVDGEATWTMDIEPAPEDSIMPAWYDPLAFELGMSQIESSRIASSASPAGASPESISLAGAGEELEGSAMLVGDQIILGLDETGLIYVETIALFPDDEGGS